MSKKKTSSEQHLAKEADKLLEIFKYLSEELKKRKGIDGLEETLIDAEKRAKEFWEEYNKLKGRVD